MLVDVVEDAAEDVDGLRRGRRWVDAAARGAGDWADEDVCFARGAGGCDVDDCGRRAAEGWGRGAAGAGVVGPGIGAGEVDDGGGGGGAGAALVAAAARTTARSPIANHTVGSSGARGRAVMRAAGPFTSATKKFSPLRSATTMSPSAAGRIPGASGTEARGSASRAATPGRSAQTVRNESSCESGSRPPLHPCDRKSESRMASAAASTRRRPAASSSGAARRPRRRFSATEIRISAAEPARIRGDEAGVGSEESEGKA